MLRCLLMRSKEVGNAQLVQQTSDIFLTLPPTRQGQKICAGVLTQKSVEKCSKNVRRFIQNLSPGSLPVPVVQHHAYMVRRPDEAPAMPFPGVLSHTKVKNEDFVKLLKHSLRCLFART